MKRIRIELMSCQMWAGTPGAFTVLVTALKTGTFAQATSLKPRTVAGQGGKIAFVPIEGVLTRDEPLLGTTYNAIHDAIDKAANDSSVKRVVLMVDSPGGEVNGAPETAAAIAQAAKIKPVSAIVEGQSASAAYWLTSQAHDITTAPSAEVGSVGVRLMHVDLSQSLEQSGIKVTELHSGEYKTEWSPFHPLSEAAKEDMQQRMDTVHRQFLTDIGSGRGARAKAQIRSARFGEGRMFNAAQAVRHGLADSVQAPREFYRAMMSQQTQPDNDLTRARARLELEWSRF